MNARMALAGSVAFVCDKFWQGENDRDGDRNANRISCIDFQPGDCLAFKIEPVVLIGK